MIKIIVFPIRRVVAQRTIVRVVVFHMVVGVVVIFLMTGPAIRRRSAVAACVTLEAVGLNMRAGQGELRVVVIEVRVVPIRRVVAQRTIVRELLLDMIVGVVVVILMTGPAIRRSSAVTTRVTLEAIGLHVRACQRELRIVVIEGRVVPVRGVVTHLTIVRVLLFDVIIGVVVIRFVA